MKKSLLALAVLGAFTGAASAQSSVTLFGVVDLNARWVQNSGFSDRWTMNTDGINSSRLGFRGVEDLGGGLRAGFWLEAGVNADTGTTNAKFFNRRSTVSLLGNWGEVRLGRDYTPSFWNTTIFDPFGTNGVGSSLNVATGYLGANAVRYPTYVRSDNAFQYFLPALGGLYGQITFAPGEGSGTGKYQGIRVGYAAGPFDVAIAYAIQNIGNGVPGFTNGYVPFTSNTSKGRLLNVAGSWDFGIVKLMGQYNQDQDSNADGRETRWLIGATAPLGQGELRASYVGTQVRGQSVGGVETNGDVSQFAIGYVYFLSKRTALYSNLAYLNNDGAAKLAIPGGPTTAGPAGFPAINAGGSSTGIEAGIRPSF